MDDLRKVAEAAAARAAWLVDDAVGSGSPESLESIIGRAADHALAQADAGEDEAEPRLLSMSERVKSLWERLVLSRHTSSSTWWIKWKGENDPWIKRGKRPGTSLRDEWFRCKPLIEAALSAEGKPEPDPSFPPGTRVVVTGRSPQDGHDFTGRVGVVAAKQDHPTAVWVLFAPDLSPVSVPGQWLSVATEPPERKAEYRTRCGRFTVIGPEGDGYSNPTRDARDALDDALKPDPVKGADPNVERVRERLRERAAAGLTRYGTDTTREDFGRADWLRELQDELLDAAVYVEALRAAEEKA